MKRVESWTTPEEGGDGGDGMSVVPGTRVPGGQVAVQTGFQQRHYVYDHSSVGAPSWNLSASFQVNELGQFIPTHDQSFAWGPDLSGSDTGAGGIGGLAVITDTSAAVTSSYVPVMDAQGNVTTLLDTSLNQAARYEYGPYGETMSAVGAMALRNPFRFSTKHTDVETGLVYYGYRYYAPGIGRWVSRDPIGELGAVLLRTSCNGSRVQIGAGSVASFADAMGDLDLYVFVLNNPAGYCDALGLQAKACNGMCGAIIDNWLKVEIDAQLAGWRLWSTQLNPDNNRWNRRYPRNPSLLGPGPGGWGPWGYIHWANGNQRYKDKSYFAFNQGTQCGTRDQGAEVGCGFSVTLCGKCVRSAILGNIMYGFVGAFAGFEENRLVTDTSNYKRRFMTVDQHDEDAYRLGYNWYRTTSFVEMMSGGGIDTEGLCEGFRSLLDVYPGALEEGRKDGGSNTLSTCRPCLQMTKEIRHGGSQGARLRP